MAWLFGWKITGIARASRLQSRSIDMKNWLVRIALAIAGIPVATLWAQTAFNWQQIKDKFEAANPTLKAAQLNIDESRAAEITAYLRPNPTATGLIDQINPFHDPAVAEWERREQLPPVRFRRAVRLHQLPS
jgi:hypothetical protein